MRNLVMMVLSVLPLCCFADLVVPAERVRHHVNVFEQPTSQSSEIGELGVGQSAELIETTSRWHRIRLADGRAGFVSRSWTDVVTEATSRQQDDLRIHFLNVGAGACTLVECPGVDAPPMIVDCGTVGRHNGFTETAARQYIEQILQDHTVNPNVVLSHPHTDHYGMIAEVLQNVQAQNIWLGGDAAGYRLKNFPAWLAQQSSGGATVHQNLPQNFHNDEQAMPDEGLGCGEAEVFTLTVNTAGSANTNSHVLEIRYDDFGATFTGDAEGATESQAIANFDTNVKTTVLSASHHGADSHSSNSVRWINATSPEVVVFSSGNRFAHPRCNIVDRYSSVLAAAPQHPTRCGTSRGYITEPDTRLARYVTAVNGVIVVTSNGQSPLSLSCTTSTGCRASIAH